MSGVTFSGSSPRSPIFLIWIVCVCVCVFENSSVLNVCCICVCAKAFRKELFRLCPSCCIFILVLIFKVWVEGVKEFLCD